MFSSKSNERGKLFENSIFKLADPSNLRRSLLEGNEDHLLSQARSELMNQEYQVGSLNSDKLMLKDWNYRMPIMDLLSLVENKLVCKKNHP